MRIFDMFNKNKEHRHKEISKDVPYSLESYQKIANEIYPGITMFVRDVDLPPVCADKYVSGMIIKERDSADSSKRVMGMTTTHRFAILSNHMADFSDFEQGTNWGLCVALSDSHFKVLDVYPYKGKTQILLLHLPDDYRWKIFKNAEFSVDKELIKKSRQIFKNKSNGEVIPELTTPEWRRRCQSPLGMSDAGVLFEIEMPIGRVSEIIGEKDCFYEIEADTPHNGRRFMLDDIKLYFLRVFFDENKKVRKYSIDIEEASDSHYELNPYEAARLAIVLDNIHHKGSFIEDLREQIKNKSQHISTIMNTHGIKYMSFHYD